MIHDDIIEAVRAHSRETKERECCGVVIMEGGKQVYVPCRNIAEKDEHFDIHDEDWYAAEDRGEIVAICHSHPFAQPTPSEADLVECELHGVEWLIVNYPLGMYHIFGPSGYVAPLIGREFSEGVQDCLALARDYYKIHQPQIVIPPFKYEKGWMLKPQKLFEENFEALGFYKVLDGTIKPHDAVLMSIEVHDKADHCGVITESGKLLHHLYNTKSREVPYGGFYRKCTTAILRHQTLS